MVKDSSKRKTRSSSSSDPSTTSSPAEKKAKDSELMNKDNLHADAFREAEGNFSDKIDCILVTLVKLNKLSKQEDIDTKLDGVIAKVKALEKKVNHLNVDLQNIEDAQVKHGEKIKALEESSQFTTKD